MAKTWIKELDAFRGLAFAAVVLQHAIGIYNRRGGLTVWDKWVTAGLFNLVKFAVPAFLFLSGLVLFYNHYQQLNYRRFLVKRFREVIIPYLCWSFFYTFFYLRRWPVTPDFYYTYGQNVLLGKAGYHLWFIILIIQFYLLFPFLRCLFQKTEKVLPALSSKALVLIGATVIYLGLTQWSVTMRLNPANSVLLHLASYRDRTFLFWFLYFLLGGIAGLNLDRFRRLLKRVFFPALLVFGGLGGYFTFYLNRPGDRLDLAYATSLKPSMVIFTLAAVSVFYYLTLKLAGSSAVLTMLGRYSLGAYFGHAVILNYSTILVLKITPGLGVLPHLSITFFLAVFLSLMVTILFSRLPIGRLVVGRVKKSA